MLFPQFSVYMSKSSYNYIDINNILFITVNLKETWNMNSIKIATRNTWLTFKDKLSKDQKIILREAIKELRNKFYLELVCKDTTWLSTSIVSTLLSSISSSILTFHKRQSTLRHFMNSLSH